MPEATGPLSSMRDLGASLTGDASAYRFYCFRCVRVRRRTKVAIASAFVVAIGAALLLEWLGLI